MSEIPAITLLIGGPRDGELLRVEDWAAPIRVANPTPSVLALFPDEPYAADLVHLNVSTYYAQRLRFFGAVLLVHVHESAGGSEASMRSLLARHLLSDLGKAVVL